MLVDRKGGHHLPGVLKVGVDLMITRFHGGAEPETPGRVFSGTRSTSACEPSGGHGVPALPADAEQMTFVGGAAPKHIQHENAPLHR